MIYARCPVCQDTFISQPHCVISALPCGHLFHNNCISTWFKNSKTCPQCRISCKQGSIIQRLYFDTIVDENNYQLNSSQDTKPLSKRAFEDICRLQLNNEELVSRLENAEAKCQSSSTQLTALQKELSSLTSLYTQTDKDLAKERQSNRDLKQELLSTRKFMRDAQSAYNQATKLQKEMDDMTSIKKLLASSEEGARDLFARYSRIDQTSGDPTGREQEQVTSMRSLCRWAAILRSELTAARAKSQGYKRELNRQRKAQASVARRLASAESDLKIKQSQLTNLKARVDSSLASPPSITASTPTSHQLEIPTSSIPSVASTSYRAPQPLSPSLFDSPATAAQSPAVGLITTPDMLAATPLLEKKQNGSLQPLRTPCVNPFSVKLDLAATPHMIPSSSDADLSSTPRLAKRRATDITTSRSSAVRRPSAIYELSIMRHHVKTCHIGTTIHGHPSAHPLSDFVQPSSSTSSRQLSTSRQMSNSSRIPSKPLTSTSTFTGRSRTKPLTKPKSKTQPLPPAPSLDKFVTHLR